MINKLIMKLIIIIIIISIINNNNHHQSIFVNCDDDVGINKINNINKNKSEIIFEKPKGFNDTIYVGGGGDKGNNQFNENDNSKSLESNSYCSDLFILNDVEYDLSKFQNKIFKIEYNSTFELYVNLCLMNTSFPCNSNDSICMVNNKTGNGGGGDNIREFHLGYYDSLKYSSNGQLGLDFLFVGSECKYDITNDNTFGASTSIDSDDEQLFSNSGSNSNSNNNGIVNGFYKTSVGLICGSIDNQKIAKFINPCHLSIIIKTNETCIVNGQPINSILKVFVILFAAIIASGFIIGFLILCRERIKNTCCCCLYNRSGYAQIDNHENININGDSILQIGSNQINNNNNQQPSNSNNNNNNNNNNSSNSNNSNRNNNNNSNLVDHTILQGQTPESDVCVICFDSKIDTVLLNCGHCILCLNCTKKVNNCPICRQNISSVVHMYQV